MTTDVHSSACVYGCSCFVFFVERLRRCIPAYACVQRFAGHSTDCLRLHLYLHRQSEWRAQPLSTLDPCYFNMVKGSIDLGFMQLPYLVIYIILRCCDILFLWNKTVFRKSMYAIGGNPEAVAVSILNVPLVVIGGGVSASFDLFEVSLKATLKDFLFLDANNNLRIEKTGLSSEASLISVGTCALYCMEREALA